MVAMQRTLGSWHQQYLHSIGRPLKPIRNQLASRYRSHKASYGNLRPKIGCYGNNP